MRQSKVLCGIGYVPEHSLQAYQLAIDLGTDYVEPDLCVSKDGTVSVGLFSVVPLDMY